MRVILFTIILTSIICSQESIDTKCVTDSTQNDSLNIARISHHLNSRNSNEGEVFDWYLNLEAYYKYNSEWHPEFQSFISTEREDGDRYDAYLIGHATDYYFIRDRVNEQNKLYLFETGIHYTLLNIRHGYSYLWWSNTRTERHAIYHRFQSNWLIAEIQYMDKIYKTEIQILFEQKWPISSDNIFMNISANYLKIYEQPLIWSVGYKLGYEF